MPFSIEGTTGRKELGALTHTEARTALMQLKMQLRPNGRGNVRSGILKLMHTTDQGQNMRFERKSWYQFIARRTTKMQTTANQIGMLLKNAGASELMMENFRTYAAEANNRISTARMVDFIEQLEVQQLGEHSHTTGEDALRSLGIAKENADGTAMKGSFGVVKNFNLTNESYGLPTNQPYILKTPKASKSRDDAGNDFEYHRWHKTTDFFGQEAQKPTSQMGFTRGTFKFTPLKPDGTTLQSSDGDFSDLPDDSGEWMSARMDKNPISGVAYNQLFIIERSREGQANDFVTLRAQVLKPWLRSQGPGTTVRLHGTLQKDAGKDLGQRILTHQELRTVAASSLNVLATAIERGYEHNDIKPANMAFNEETQEVTLIDPGQLFKLSKRDNYSYERSIEGQGTPVYYPELSRRTKIESGTTYISGGRSDVQAMVTSLKQLMGRRMGVTLEQYGESDHEEYPTFDDFLSKKLEEKLDDALAADEKSDINLLRLLDRLRDHSAKNSTESYLAADRQRLAATVRDIRGEIQQYGRKKSK